MSQDDKTTSLRRFRSLNPHPERVQDPLFLSNAFFDSRDLVQVRYEMLRRVHEEGLSVSETAETVRRYPADMVRGGPQLPERWVVRAGAAKAWTARWPQAQR